jgi:ParB-like chromosome segregation protein Spo0J
MTVITTPCIILDDGVEFELPFADLLPDLAPDIYDELKASISEHGIQVPILVNEWGDVIDGQHRLRIAKELGFTSEQVPQQYFLETAESREDSIVAMRDLAVSLNIHRRQLDPETRARLVATLKATGLSNRAIAEQISVDEKTVRNDLGKCSGAEDSAPEHPEESTGTDGKTYPAKPAKDTIAERRERVAEAKAEGKSHRAIAEEVGVSVGTVHADLNAVTDEEPQTEALCGDCGWGENMIQEKPDSSTEKAEDSSTDEEEDDDEFIDHHRDRIRRHTSESVTDNSPAKPSPLSKWEKDRLRREAEEKSRLDALPKVKLIKLDPNRWKLVAEPDRDLVGLISRGGPQKEDNYGFTGYALVPADGTTREVQLLPSYGERFESLKAIKKEIREALGDPIEYLKGLDTKTSYRGDHLSTKKPKFPSGQVNDLPLENGEWKKEHGDLITGSLMVFGPRAKGKGRKNSYHGNCIPQIPDQKLRKLTHSGDLVLDMFLGSATSMVESVRLGRHFIGVDVKPDMVKAAEEESGKLANPSDVKVKLISGDSSGALVSHSIREYLEEIGRDSVDHVFLHPPYFDIVQFTEGEDERDLSSAKSLDTFLRQFEKVAWRSIDLLAPGGFLTLVIGDITQGPEWIPLGFLCMQAIGRVGNVILKSINPKDMQGNERGKENVGVQEYRALRNGTSVFKHEYVMVFRKGVE